MSVSAGRNRTKQKMTQDKKRHIENLKKEVIGKFGRTVEAAADFDTLSIAIQRRTKCHHPVNPLPLCGIHRMERFLPELPVLRG